MTFTFIDVDLEPLEVEPVNKDGVRFYKLPKTDKYYPSVTSITSFKNAAFFSKWRKKQLSIFKLILEHGNILFFPISIVFYVINALLSFLFVGILKITKKK